MLIDQSIKRKHGSSHYPNMYYSDNWKKKTIRFKIGGIPLCNQFFLDYVVVITKATNSKINKIWIYLTKTEIEIIEYEGTHTHKHTLVKREI